jgi:hypothetical protein
MCSRPIQSGPELKTNNRKISPGPLQKLRKYHKWPALIISFFLLLFALSGIVLNHRDIFSSVDISRKWLPSEYRYNNWNLASVKSALQVSDDSVVIYGNIGIWLTDPGFSSFSDYADGFPRGIDNRKIFTVYKTKDGHIYAGAQSGLYRLDRRNEVWERVNLPVSENRVIGITQKGDSILVMTRSNILSFPDSRQPVFTLADLPPAADADDNVSLFRTIWLIHSGKIYGVAGKIIVDIMAGVMIFLIISGLFYYFTPGLLKKMTGKKARTKLKQTNRFFIKWHNSLGYLTAAFLIIISVTGIFLRPPLLIPIAGIKVPVIKNSWLDNPNPWFDKLRDIIWDGENNIFLFSTSEGIYYSGPELSGRLQPFQIEPPVSVMGVNVFEKSGPGEYLVGSFSGIFRWNVGTFPSAGAIRDHLTGHPVINVPGQSSPFGSFPVSGRLDYLGSEVLFDYLNGAFVNDREVRSGNSSISGFVSMPENISENSPISLWNLALEVHTGRIFFPLIGNFYIFYVPLMGITTLVVLVSGFLIWWKKKRRTK